MFAFGLRLLEIHARAVAKFLFIDKTAAKFTSKGLAAVA
jgi:hypothetical protein